MHTLLVLSAARCEESQQILTGICPQEEGTDTHSDSVSKVKLDANICDIPGDS
jgi:hypothetical protein